MTQSESTKEWKDTSGSNVVQLSRGGKSTANLEEQLVPSQLLLRRKILDAYRHTPRQQDEVRIGFRYAQSINDWLAQTQRGQVLASSEARPDKDPKPSSESTETSMSEGKGVFFSAADWILVLVIIGASVFFLNALNDLGTNIGSQMAEDRRLFAEQLSSDREAFREALRADREATMQQIQANRDAFESAIKAEREAIQDLYRSKADRVD